MLCSPGVHAWINEVAVRLIKSLLKEAFETLNGFNVPAVKGWATQRPKS